MKQHLSCASSFKTLFQAAAATSGVAVLMTSSAAFLVGASDGGVNHDYGLIYGAGGFVASIGTVFGIKYIIQHLKRPSIISIILAVVLTIGTVLSYIFGIMELVADHSSKAADMCGLSLGNATAAIVNGTS